LINKRTWHGPNGQFKFIPKDEDMGFMASVFISREFGVGFKDWCDDLMEK